MTIRSRRNYAAGLVPQGLTNLTRERDLPTGLFFMIVVSKLPCRILPVDQRSAERKAGKRSSAPFVN
jgi:hypothetical protein